MERQANLGGDGGDDRKPVAAAAMDVRIDPKRWRKRRGMAKLLDTLGAKEGLTRYVGGAVRDDLLGLPVSDVDLATRLRPDEVVERLQVAGIKAVPTGFEHGTITAVSDGHAYEVTTLRRDVETFGRHATVAFTDDWQEDAARRDFTINALMADPVTGEIFDYFGGLEDLEERHVRFIGDAFERIAEDHLRILRFFRFHARFGRGEPDQMALAACTARANDLMALSRERIADELLKLLAVDDPSPTVQAMLDRSILKPVLPEIDSGAAKSLEALVQSEHQARIEADPIRHLVALLPRDSGIAEMIATRLKLSNRARKRIACAAISDIAADARATAYRVGVDCAVDRLLLNERPADAKELQRWKAPRLPISGGELIKRGLKEGPIVSRTLRRIEDRWIEAGFATGPQFEAIVADCVAEGQR
jgi:poly(A) polymerase